eukprot:m.16832 g.16832  ORF g.16832 m.16832 type:complete len:313 (+) comp5819_c0_seq1:181-1119(+)
MRVFSLFAVLYIAHLSTAKKVGFFTNFLKKSGSSQYDGDFVVQWLEDASTLAGHSGVFLSPNQSAVYYCCNAAGIQSDGSLETIIQPPSAYGKNLTAPLKARGVDVYFVVGLDEQCVMNECWKSNPAGLNSMISLAESQGFDGWIVDYEPTTNYTNQHAELYGRFLAALSVAMHAVGKKSGFCASNWGIVDVNHFAQPYAQSQVDLVSNMGSYSFPGAMAPLQNYLVNAIRHLAPLGGAKAISSDVGTMMVPPYKPPINFNWQPDTLSQFLNFVASQGVEQVTAWRADVDDNYPANATQPWFFQALASFMNN